MRLAVARLACSGVLLLLPVLVCAQAARGVVVDQTGLPLPGVRIDVRRGEQVIHAVMTNADGSFELPVTEPGDLIEAALDGFETVRVAPSEATRMVLPLARATMATEVTASALTSSGVAMERLGSTLRAPLAQRLPAPRPRILQSLPLLPSVVRGPDGLLRIGGTRPHESALWIDGFDVTDPVTGTSAIDLPLESVKGLAVLRDPISATFGGVLGALASVETAAGGDTFSGGVQGFIPRPRLSQMGLGRIEGFFPRAYVGGRVGLMRYFTSAEFNFERVAVPGVTSSSGSPDIGTIGVTSFARLDFTLSPANTLTLESIFVPGRTTFSGLSPLRDVLAAPDIRAHDLFAGLVDRIVFGARDVLTIRFGTLAHGTALASAGRGDAVLGPDGWRQNWFAQIDHWGTRQSLSLTWDRTGIPARGTHTLSVSADFSRRALLGALAHNSIQIRDDDDRLTRLIEFGPGIRVRTREFTGGVSVRDQWEASRRLQFDIGVRLDWYGETTRPAPSPRLGVRYALDEHGHTVVKASVGRFVGRVPLGALAFDQFPARTDTVFDRVTGAPRTVVYQPVSAPLQSPRADGIALELEHEIRPGLDAQIGVRQRLGSHLPTVEVPPDGGVARLASTGTSTYRELQFSIRRIWRDDRQAFLSYVRSLSRGETNDFGTLFANMDTPLLEPGGMTPSAADVPHRLRGWATFALPEQIVVSPAIEWRTGFPYSVQDFYRHYIGAPNRERFPAHFALDVTVFKTFDVFERQMDLGLQFFNATGHFNPRDVIGVEGSPRFQEFTNSFGLTLGGYMQVRWQ